MSWQRCATRLIQGSQFRVMVGKRVTMTSHICQGNSLQWYMPRRPLTQTPRRFEDRKEPTCNRIVEESQPSQNPSSQSFAPTRRAEKASEINLSAQLAGESSPTEEAQSESGSWSEAKRLFKLAKDEKKPLSIAISLLLASSAISMSIPFSFGRVVDVFTNGSDNKILGMSFPVFMVSLAGVFVVGAACNTGRVMLMRLIGERIVTRVRTNVYKSIMRQDAEFFDANPSGALVSRIAVDTSIVGKAITSNVSDGLRAIVTGIVGVSMMAYVSPKLTLIMLCVIPPVSIGAVFFGRYLKTISRKTQTALGEMTRVSEERLANVKTIQAFGGEPLEVNRFRTKVLAVYDLAKREAIVSGVWYGGVGLSGNLTILAVLSFGGSMVLRGQISIGELTSFLMYSAYVGSSMMGLSGFYTEVMKGIGAGSRVFELIDRPPSITADEVIGESKGKELSDARGTIRFEKVKFAYPTRPGLTIFRDLSFEIRAGQSVAIVGPSGQGKSTIAALLLRFYDPTAGKISFNGNDLRELNLRSWRRQIGVVAQEPVLFSGTIRENIAYGKAGATENEIRRAAQAANCHFIADLPNGFETDVGPRGTALSGGQKQRIAIARSLLRNPSILLLDEATSALDAESEVAVNDALRKVIEASTTVIIIAHRLSSVREADMIIVLDNRGSIAEMGNFAALAAREGGAFRKLMSAQLVDR